MYDILVAVIRWKEDSFLQISCDGNQWKGLEFSVPDTEDSYYQKTFNQMWFAALDAEKNTSRELESFSIKNEDGKELRQLEFSELVDVVKHLLREMDTFRTDDGTH